MTGSWMQLFTLQPLCLLLVQLVWGLGFRVIRRWIRFVYSLIYQLLTLSRFFLCLSTGSLAVEVTVPLS